MRAAYYGFLACAAVYTAVGVFGLVLFTTQPNIARASDGYGTTHLAAQR